MCVDVCHPNDSITCGVYGHNVSVYFVITPMLQINMSDSDIVQIQGNNGVSFAFPFGSPVSQAQSDNVALIHPERTCGIVVNSATVHDSGQYMCKITHYVVVTVATLKQTLQLCGR
jgi:hypothetical protein